LVLRETRPDWPQDQYAGGCPRPQGGRRSCREHDEAPRDAATAARRRNATGRSVAAPARRSMRRPRR